MPTPKKPTKMTELKIDEFSGVDRPAHGSDGFPIIKSTAAQATRFMRGGEDEMPDTKLEDAKPADLVKALGGVKPEDLTAIAKEFTAEQLAPVISALQALAPETDDKPVEKVEDEPTDGIPAALEKAAKSDPIMKAALDEMRANLVKSAETAAEAVKIAKAERDTNLDNAAITKSRETLDLAIDHDTVAPAIRKMRTGEATPAEQTKLADEVDTLLKALNEQSKTSELFKEHGTAAPGASSTQGRIDAAAAALVKAGTVPNHAAGVAKALADDKDLLNDYLKEV